MHLNTRYYSNFIRSNALLPAKRVVPQHSEVGNANGGARITAGTTRKCMPEAVNTEVYELAL